MDTTLWHPFQEFSGAEVSLDRRRFLFFVSLAATSQPFVRGMVGQAAETGELRFDFRGSLMSKRGGRIVWPEPWSIWTGLRGQASLQIEDGPTSIGRVAHFHTASGSLVLYRNLRSRPIDLHSVPWLTWTWTAEKLPAGGSVFRSSRNDQSLQVYLAFRRSGGYNILGYVWDTATEERANNVSRQSFRSLIFGSIDAAVHVLRQGPINGWLAEIRDVKKDCAQYFSGGPSALAAVGIWSDSDHTRAISDGKIGPLVFSASKPEDRVTAVDAAN